MKKSNTNMTEQMVHNIWKAETLENKKTLILEYLNSLKQIDSIKKLIDDVNSHTFTVKRCDEFATNLYLQGIGLYTNAGSDSDITKKRISYLKNKKEKK